MSFKKIFSMMMAIITMYTCGNTLFAMEGEIPSTDVPGWNSKKIVKEMDDVLRQIEESDGKIAAFKLKVEDLEVINKQLRDDLNNANQEKFGLERQVIIQQSTIDEQVNTIKNLEKWKEKWEDDALCEGCCSCGLYKVFDVGPSNCLCRSKRFYKGVVIGSLVAVVLLVGIYVVILVLNKNFNFLK